MSPKRRSLVGVVRLVAPAVVTVTVLAVLLARIDLAQVGAALLTADASILVGVALLSLVFNTAQAAELLRQLLRGFGVRVPYAAAFVATTWSLAVHAAMPASMGHVSRVAYLVRRHGVDLPHCAMAAFPNLGCKRCWLLTRAVVGGLLLDA